MSALRTDIKRTCRSGYPPNGNSCDSCICHTRVTAEAAVGVAILRIQSNMTIGLTMDEQRILTFLPPDVSLCAGHVIGRNARDLFCVLDAEGKVIMRLRVRYVLTADQIKNFFYHGKMPQNDDGAPIIELSTENITRKRSSGTANGRRYRRWSR